MTRVLYPELARLVASNDRHTVRHVYLRLTAASTLIALLFVAVVVVIARRMLRR